MQTRSGGGDNSCLKGSAPQHPVPSVSSCWQRSSTTWTMVTATRGGDAARKWVSLPSNGVCSERETDQSPGSSFGIRESETCLSVSASSILSPGGGAGLSQRGQGLGKGRPRGTSHGAHPATAARAARTTDEAYTHSPGTGPRWCPKRKMQWAQNLWIYADSSWMIVKRLKLRNLNWPEQETQVQVLDPCWTEGRKGTRTRNRDSISSSQTGRWTRELCAKNQWGQAQAETGDSLLPGDSSQFTLKARRTYLFAEASVG